MLFYHHINSNPLSLISSFNNENPCRLQHTQSYMIFILNTKECLFNHHCYTMYDKFCFAKYKNVNLCLGPRLPVDIYVYYYLCLFMFFLIYVVF